MNVSDAETKSIDTAIFVQHAIADLNTGIAIIVFFFQSGEASTVKGNKHTQT